MKNTDTAGLKGYDAGKKVSGIKRHIAVDAQGLPHAVAVMEDIHARARRQHAPLSDVPPRLSHGGPQRDESNLSAIAALARTADWPRHAMAQRFPPYPAQPASVVVHRFHSVPSAAPAR